MEIIKKTNWFVDENELKISTMNYYVSVNIKKNNKRLYFPVKVINSNHDELLMNLYSLEDVISFVENGISKSKNFDEIIEYYESYFKRDKMLKELEVKDEAETKKISIPFDEVDDMIANHFGEGKSYKVSGGHEVFKYDDEQQVYFYLVEHLNYAGIKDHKTFLTNGDLEILFKDYLKPTNYELVDYKCARTNPQKDDNEDINAYELEIKEKEKGYCLIKNKNK